MKKILMITLLLITFTALFAPSNDVISIVLTEAINPVAQIWVAVKMVESTNNDSVINYSEGAYGCGQIRQVKLDDYNRTTGSKITLIDCLNEGISRKIFFWHCSRYYDLEIAAKRWNGSGPATEIYWEKVKRYLR